MLCSKNEACPGGYTCADGKDVAGADVKQCKPTDGACSCSKWAVDNKAKTTCTDASGKCQGEVACAAEGESSACSAATPAKETCNALDDDCNGQTDDGDAPKSCPPVAKGQAACVAGKCAVGDCQPG